MKREFLLAACLALVFLPLGFYLHNYLLEQFVALVTNRIETPVMVTGTGSIYSLSRVFAIIFGLVPLSIVIVWWLGRIASRAKRWMSALVAVAVIIISIITGGWISFSRLQELTVITIVPGIETWPDISGFSFTPALICSLLASMLINYLMLKSRKSSTKAAKAKQ